MAKANHNQSASKARAIGTQTKPLGAVLSLMKHRATEKTVASAIPHWDVSMRKDVQTSHTILMDVLSHAGLLVAALERLEGDEPEMNDCVHAGGAELAATMIKTRISEAAHLLDADLGSEAADIRHELLGVWSMAALAAHALDTNAPFYGREGESIVCSYPAIAAIRSVMKSADELTDRIDLLLVEDTQIALSRTMGAGKRAT